jgi:hypothetical protein
MRKGNNEELSNHVSFEPLIKFGGNALLERRRESQVEHVDMGEGILTRIDVDVRT